MSPINSAEIPWPAKSPAKRRTVVPEFPQSKGWGGLINGEPIISTELLTEPNKSEVGKRHSMDDPKIKWLFSSPQSGSESIPKFIHYIWIKQEIMLKNLCLNVQETKY